MKTTAQINQRLSACKARYTALVFEIAREKRRFHYPADLVDEMTEVRNEIVALEWKLTHPELPSVIAARELLRSEVSPANV